MCRNFIKFVGIWCKNRIKHRHYDVLYYDVYFYINFRICIHFSSKSLFLTKQSKEIQQNSSIEMKDNETDMMVKFNELKSKYEKNAVEHNMELFDEEYLKEQDLRTTMEKLNVLVERKIGELKTIKDRLVKLTNYKKAVGEILIDMRKTEKKYITTYETIALYSCDLELEAPKHNILHYQLSSGDLRRTPDDKDMVVEPIKLRGQIFSIKSEYVNSLCDIYEKVDDRIECETLKMKKITDFLDIYKNTIDACDTHKKVLSKYNCTVCYENEVKMCIQPCGHTFCVGCTEKITTRCFVCNGNVTAKIKIYLLGKEEEEDNSPTDTRGVEPVNAVDPRAGRNNGAALIGQLVGMGAVYGTRAP